MDALAISAVVIHLSGSFGYFRDTWLGKTSPNRVSWLIWVISGGIGFFASLAKGATWSTLPVFLATLGPALVLLASYHNKTAVWKVGRFDWVCGSLSFVGLALWQMTDNASLAILFALLSDLFASLPTLKKSWTHPETETGWSYLPPVYSSFIGVYLAANWSFHEVAFPIYLMVINGLIFLIVYSRRLSRHLGADADQPCKPLER